MRTPWFPATFLQASYLSLASPSTPSSGATIDTATPFGTSAIRGSPFTENPPGPMDPTTPDARPVGFPRGQFAQPVNTTIPPGYLPEVPLNGSIKVAAFTEPMEAGELNIVNLLDLNNTIVFATVAFPDGRLRSILRTTTGGQTWDDVTPTNFTPPANPLYTTGNFSHSILVLNQNTVFVGGQGLNANGTATIIMTTDAGRDLGPTSPARTPRRHPQHDDRRHAAGSRLDRRRPSAAAQRHMDQPQRRPCHLDDQRRRLRPDRHHQRDRRQRGQRAPTSSPTP